jgi:hypothetical protein
MSVEITVKVSYIMKHVGSLSCVLNIHRPLLSVKKNHWKFAASCLHIMPVKPHQ